MKTTHIWNIALWIFLANLVAVALLGGCGGGTGGGSASSTAPTGSITVRMGPAGTDRVAAHISNNAVSVRIDVFPGTQAQGTPDASTTAALSPAQSVTISVFNVPLGVHTVAVTTFSGPNGTGSPLDTGVGGPVTVVGGGTSLVSVTLGSDVGRLFASTNSLGVLRFDTAGTGLGSQTPTPFTIPLQGLNPFIDAIHVDQPDDLLLASDISNLTVHAVQNASSSTPSDTATPVGGDSIRPQDALFAGTLPNLKSFVLNTFAIPFVIQRIGPGGIEATFHDDGDLSNTATVLAYDNTHDALYVATNAGPVFCYVGLLTAASGNVTPTSSVNFTGNGFANALDVDVPRDFLYVAVGSLNGVARVPAGALRAGTSINNVAPTFTDGALSATTALAVDSTHDQLYVSNGTDFSGLIDRFDSPDTLSGAATADSVLALPANSFGVLSLSAQGQR